VRNKLSKDPKRINKVIFNEEGNMMTVGQQHFKIWSFNQGIIVKVPVQNQSSTIMEGRNVGLRKELIDKEFVSVVSRNGFTVALTSDGFLCNVNKDGIVYKHAYIVGKEAICGGKNADIKIISL
jgi:hypothetical protein